MANALITPDIIARETMMHMYEQMQVAPLVHRNYEADFGGKQGDTITVRRPATFTVDEFDRANGIQLQDITEGSFTVTLDTIPDVSFAVTAEELTLDIDEFSERFLTPAAEALAQWLDREVLAIAAGAGVVQTVGVNATTPTDPTLLVDAGKILNDNLVPRTGRFTVLTTAAEAAFVKSPLLHEADKRGDTAGLRDAYLGRVFGFENYASTNLPAGGESVAMHGHALSLVTRTLALPRGTGPGNASVINYKGFGLRVVQAYDISLKQDVISVDALVGTKLLDADKAVKILG